MAKDSPEGGEERDLPIPKVEREFLVHGILYNVTVDYLDYATESILQEVTLIYLKPLKRDAKSYGAHEYKGIKEDHKRTTFKGEGAILKTVKRRALDAIKDFERKFGTHGSN